MAVHRADFPSTYAAVSKARNFVVSFARWAGLSGEALHDLECAIGEALANAVEHGHRPGSHFTVSADVVDGAVVVDVKDYGAGFEASQVSPGLQPPSQSPRGFGIFIMRCLVDRIQYSERGTRVLLVKKIPVAASDTARREA